MEGRRLCKNQTSEASGHWLISTQVSEDGGDLAGVRPSTKTDALRLLDRAYADDGTVGGNVFRKDRLNGGLWGAVLFKDRHLKGDDPRRAAAVVAHYKEWLPPWKRS